MAEWVQATIAGVTLLFLALGGIWVFTNKVEKKADKEAVAINMSKIELTIQRLSDKMDNIEKLLIELKKDNDIYQTKLEIVEKGFTVLQTEHNNRKHC